MLLTSGSASGDIRHRRFLVRSALVFTLLRDSTLRMCHRYNVLKGYAALHLLIVVTQFLQFVPDRVGSRLLFVQVLRSAEAV